MRTANDKASHARHTRTEGGGASSRAKQDSRLEGGFADEAGEAVRSCAKSDIAWLGRRRLGATLLVLGVALLVAAICLAGANLYASWHAGAASDEALEELTLVTPLHDALSAGSYDERYEMPTVEVDGRQYVGAISIPALGLNLPVLSELSYGGLRVAPCRYAGTAYAGNMVIAAHNFSAHFGGVGRLQAEDEVVFRDVDGNEFVYRVVLVDVLAPDAVSDMTSPSSFWDLTLFTCTLDGTQRITVRCAEV